jgi:Txe/YoeB family toxin of Txe-Axe toxin-antitoxin module/phage-related protein
LKTSSQAVEQGRQQLASLAEAKVASLNQATQDEYAQRLAQALRNQTEEMRAAADGEVVSIRKAAAEVIAQLQGQLEQQAQAAVATLRNELWTSSQAVEQSKQQLADLAEAKLASLGPTTRDEYAQRLEQALRERTQEMHATADAELESIRRAAAEGIATLREELRSSSQAAEQSKQHLASLAEATVTSLSQATHDEYAQRLAQALHEQTQEVHAAADAEVESIRKAAAEAVGTLREELQTSSRAVEHSKQLLVSLAEAKLASLSQTAQGEYAQRLAQALDQQTREMRTVADGEVQSIKHAAAEAIGQLSDKLQRQVEAAVATLREELQSSSQAVEQSRQQLTSLAEAKVASLSQATQDEYAQRLAQALRNQTEEMRAAADGEVQSIRQAAAEAIGQIQGKLQEQAEAAVATLREELKTSSQAVEQGRQQLASLAEAKVASLSQATQDEYAQRLAQALREQTQEMRAAADGEVVSIRQAAAEAIGQIQGKLQEQAEAAVATLREELKTSNQAVEQGRQQLASLAEAKIASLSQATQDEYAQRLAQALRNQTEEMRAAAEGEVQSIRQAAAEAIAQLKTVEHTQESTLQARTEATEERLTWATSAVGVLQGQVEALTKGLEGQHATKKADLERIAAQVGANWSQQFQEQAAAAVEALHTRMTALTEDFQAQQANKAGDLETISKDLEGRCSQRIEEEAKAARDALQARVGELASDFAEKHSKRAEDWEQLAQEVGGRWSRQFQEQAEVAVRRLREEVENSARVVEETKKQLAGLAQPSLPSAGQAIQEETGWQLTETLREQVQQIQAAADAEVKAIKLAAQDAIAEAQVAGQKREEDFLARTGVAEERLKAVSEAVESLTDSVHAGGGLQAADLDNVAQELSNRMTLQFEKQTELAVEKVRSEVRSAGRAVEELARQLAGLAETKRASLNQVAANAAAGFEAQQRKLKMQFDTSRKDLEDLVARRMARLSVGSIHSATPSDKKGLIVKLGVGAGLFLIVVAFLLTVSLSTHTVMQLRNDAPSEFVDDNPTWNAKRRSKEQEVAQAYWRAAAVSLQAKYPFGSDLPADPPDGFQVDSTYDPQGGPKAVADLRLHYWDRVREAWHQHSFWVEIQEPDTTWSARFHHTWERIAGK